MNETIKEAIENDDEVANGKMIEIQQDYDMIDRF